MSDLAWCIDTVSKLLVGVGSDLVLVDTATGAQVGRSKLVVNASVNASVDLSSLRGAVTHPHGGCVFLTPQEDGGVYEVNYKALAEGTVRLVGRNDTNIQKDRVGKHARPMLSLRECCPAWNPWQQPKSFRVRAPCWFDLARGFTCARRTRLSSGSCSVEGCLTKCKR
jgi:hypothetical protein